MKSFLQRFALLVSGVLSGFDRVVFKGRLPQLYSPDGMNCYASANHVRYLDFKAHAKEVTRQVLAASLVLKQANALGSSGHSSPGCRRRTLIVLLRREQPMILPLCRLQGSLSFLQGCFRRRRGSEHPDSDFVVANVNTAVRRADGRRSAGRDSSSANDRSAFGRCG